MEKPAYRCIATRRRIRVTALDSTCPLYPWASTACGRSMSPGSPHRSDKHRRVARRPLRSHAGSQCSPCKHVLSKNRRSPDDYTQHRLFRFDYSREVYGHARLSSYCVAPMPVPRIVFVQVTFALTGCFAGSTSRYGTGHSPAAGGRHVLATRPGDTPAKTHLAGYFCPDPVSRE